MCGRELRLKGRIQRIQRRSVKKRKCTGELKLKKKSAGSYYEIGKVKAEWADKIGASLDLKNNMSPSFNYFLLQLKTRVETA